MGASRGHLSDLLVITGVHANTLTFRRCRAAVATGEYFIMKECPVGKVMNIKSAVLGYSKEYYPDTDPPWCPGYDCAVHSDEPVRLCNGSRTCRIRQTILYHPKGLASALCGLSTVGNFIRIGFTCVTGTVFFNVFVRDMSWAVPWTVTIGGVADSDACAGGLGHALRRC